MAEIVPLREEQPRRLSGRQFLDKVRELIERDRIKYTAHALQRGRQRNVTPTMIVGCLENGTVREGPFLNIHQNWQATICRHKAGKELSVVAAIEWEKQVIVITAY